MNILSVLQDKALEICSTIWICLILLNLTLKTDKLVNFISPQLKKMCVCIYTHTLIHLKLTVTLWGWTLLTHFQDVEIRFRKIKWLSVVIQLCSQHDDDLNSAIWLQSQCSSYSFCSMKVDKLIPAGSWGAWRSLHHKEVLLPWGPLYLSSFLLLLQRHSLCSPQLRVILQACRFLDLTSPLSIRSRGFYLFCLI